MKKTLLSLVGVLLLLAGLLGGCATERNPVDKSDPNALDKRLFQGEWFYKQTIVDLPYSIDYSFVGETNKLKIIKWEVTENWLIGYNVHENIESTNTGGVIAPAKTPVVAYPIMDHFDILYAENAATGEHVPVKVANHDKPWWQRQYFLINPSASAVTNFEMEYLNITVETENPYRQEPIGGYFNLEFMAKDETAINPKAYDPSAKPVETFSFQSDFIVSPNNNWRNISSWDDIANFIKWEPARIRQRHFFWKVERNTLAQNGFEPMEYQDEMFRRFGFFTRDYRAVDPLRGYKENYHHLWANHYNINKGNRVEYYLSPNFPHYLELAACSIGADYNHAFSKAAYEGAKASAKGAAGFESDFPSQIKLQDGLYEIGQKDDPSTPGVDESKVKSSLLMPDAYTPFPDPIQLDPTKFYYIDYLVEFLKPKADWVASKDTTQKDAFLGRRDKIAQAYRDYCFSTPDENDKFVIKRNEFLPYDAVRDGVDPEGNPNMITPEVIHLGYGTDIDKWLARPVNYPVACKLTLEHRCETEQRRDANGAFIMDGANRRLFPVARWKAELGDPRYSMIYWVDKPTDYGILGVAQWSDNPENGQIFSGVAHIAGSVLQWSVGRELERFEMLDALKQEGYNPTAERYQQLLNDLIIDTEYAHRPQTPEETDTPDDDKQQAGDSKDNTTLKAMRLGGATLRGPASVATGSANWAISASMNPALREFGNTGKPSTSNAGTMDAISNAEKLSLLKEKHLPQMHRKANYSAIKGTAWESYLSPNGVLDFLYPGQTAFNEEMLYGFSPAYWGGVDAWKRLRDREIMFTEKCYFQAEWLDAGFLEIIKDLAGKGYTREDIRRTIEAVMFKGVAQHEVGHAIGLRHNFMGSADELNYAGSKTTLDSDVTHTRLANKDGSDVATGYWKFKGKFEGDIDVAVANYAKEKGLKNVTEQQRFYLSKQIASPRDWYMYSSVMDYMDEFYFHGFGLGRYDVAAILFVYGRAVEKMKAENGVSGALAIDDKTKEPKEVIKSLFEERLCTKDDLYLNACACADDDTACKCIQNDKLGDVYCFNPTKKVKAVRREPTLTKVVEGGKQTLANVDGSLSEIQLNGDVRPYLYCPDHWTYDHPMCKTWDKGYRASDILRNMIDQYQRFYYYRFFKRGNPRFRYLPHIWVNSVMRFFPFAHYALDFNYNKFQLKEWLPLVINPSIDPFNANTPLVRKEYLLALQGKERWIDPKTNEVGQLTPGGPGDYLIAAMLGFNFLIYDVLYSADVGAHVLNSWNDDPSKKYFEKNPYIFDDADLKANVGGKILNVDLRYGHFHKNHWNRQDNLNITEEQFVRLGFTIEKEAAAFMITNSGWWVDKYGYENMANGFHYVSDGFKNTIFHVMADIMNENHLWTFSRLCANEDPANKNEFKLNVFEPRINELMLWGHEEVEGLAGAEKSDMSTTICQKLQAQQRAVDKNSPMQIPVHASWVYFDKFTPALWALLNLPNAMADNTVYRYFYADVIPAAQHSQWAPVTAATPNVVECISGKEDQYYRAYNYPMDERPNPIFNLIKRCKQIQDLCVNDQSLGQVPGNLKDTCGNYPRWYLQRTIDYIEATILMLNSFGKWTSDIGFFVLM